MITFKQWMEIADYGEPVPERPDLLATAMPSVNPEEDPPKGPQTATKNYVIKTKFMKKCKKT